MSAGLHLSKVGSEFKIDCSYLSPNVSIATSIERSTACLARVCGSFHTNVGIALADVSCMLVRSIGWRAKHGQEAYGVSVMVAQSVGAAVVGVRNS